jgi:hypothetical protein
MHKPKTWHMKRGEEIRLPHIMVGKLQGKRPLGRPRRKWVNNIKMVLRELGWDGVEWIDMA